jgi:radical SAM enzyme (TIGR01210 family)
VNLAFPSTASGRDLFVLERRAERERHDAWRHQGLIVEDERAADGRRARVATVFLTGRECPWRCTMCDLWKHTTEEDTPPGAIPAQIAAARGELRYEPRAVTGMKLYNAGSFFDPRAVPVDDYDEVAAHLIGLTHVIVESHPALIGSRVELFREALGRHRAASGRPAALEVAMGLETAHPRALDCLNKRFTVEDFRAAAVALLRRGATLRVFLLISPPFVPADGQDSWLVRSVDTAFSCGASVVSLIPARGGNGAMESLASAEAFREPSLDDIERSVAMGLSAARGRGRVFGDLWDLKRFSTCPSCFDRRRARLDAMNLEQLVLAVPPTCAACGHAG